MDGKETMYEFETQAPFAICEFDFGEAQFREYYELRFVPHDRPTGWKFMWLGFFPLTLGVVLLTVVLSSSAAKRVFEGAELPTGLEIFGTIFLIVWCLSYAAVAIHGFRLWRGMRHPRWGTPRWNARTELSFNELASGPTRKPVAPRADEFRSIGLYPLVTLAWVDANWNDEPYGYDFIPGLVPWFSKKELEAKIPSTRKVTFTVRFYKDFFIKGSGDQPLKNDYDDIFDIVEDKRFPNLAIIRMKDEVSEIVIHKDSFEGTSWEGVKDYIKQKNGWVTLREAVLGERRKR